MQKEKGFTVIELAIAIVVLVIIGVFFLVQRNDLEVTARDQQRKVAINSIYYSLTEVFHKENGFYPTSINHGNLKSVAPELFIDTQGTAVGEIGSEYFYEGINCNSDGKCRGFRLSAALEKEAEYIREVK
ncbi:type II secretion system GspH family protein [Candidatus Saccharibacteria bacterium]|jgi:type II secretory pathway pseudopilin PulG|nr:type II secretion system GspH family protein [Candidatus Saccharibacteria bacterium]